MTSSNSSQWARRTSPSWQMLLLSSKVDISTFIHSLIHHLHGKLYRVPARFDPLWDNNSLKHSRAGSPNKYKSKKSEYGEGPLLHCWWKCKLIQPLWKTVWRLLKKLKIELSHDLAIPLLGIYLEKNMIRKHTYTPKFIAALFTIAKTWKQPKCP